MICPRLGAVASTGSCPMSSTFYGIISMVFYFWEGVMTDRDFPKSVINELIHEGFHDIKVISRNRFFASFDERLFEFRVKYCIIPRRLKFIDVGYMTSLMSPDSIRVFISNGTDCTNHVRDHFRKNEIISILNWNNGVNIIDNIEVDAYEKNVSKPIVKEINCMNGFELLSASYRKAAESGDISLEQAEKDCRVFDFLSTCDNDDLFRLFDSSAFNEIAMSYLRQAVKELVSEGTLDEDQARAVRNRFSYLFSEKKAKEVFDQ